MERGRRLKALLIVLACSGLMGQGYNVPFARGTDQLLSPDDASAAVAVAWRDDNGSDCTGENCFTYACEANVDEDPASPDGNLVATNAVSDDTQRFLFPTPVCNPSTLTGDQFVRVMMSRCATCVEDSGGDDPNYDVSLSCAGTFKFNIATGVDVTGLDQVSLHSFTYTTDAQCDAAGANIEIGINNNSSADREVCLEAIQLGVTC